jgi:DNA modification methylase
MTITIYRGDCRERLQSISDKTFHTVVTSPPYWGLRDYGTATWIGGDPNCPHYRTNHTSDKCITGHKKSQKSGGIASSIYKTVCPECGAVRQDRQLGLEETPQEYVANMVQVFREVRRVLRDDGTLWLNLGDTYYNYRADGKYPKQTVSKTKQDLPEFSTARGNKLEGLKSKDLIGIPWRVAFALQEDGWYLRQDIIWHKPNPMPESVKDRCTKSHEYIFLFSKSKNYYFDNESIKVESSPLTEERNKNKFKGAFKGQFKGTPNEERWQEGRPIDKPNFSEDGKSNKRSVWTVTTKPYKEAHFATYPPDLIEPCILAGCPDKVCKSCGTPYEKIYDSKKIKRNELDPKDSRYRPNNYEGAYKDINGKGDAGYNITDFVGYKQQCNCTTKETEGGHVLDPFGGAGTTALVSDRLKRHSSLIELNDKYAKITEKRLQDDGGMFMDIQYNNERSE